MGGFILVVDEPGELRSSICRRITADRSCVIATQLGDDIAQVVESIRPSAIVVHVDRDPVELICCLGTTARNRTVLVIDSDRPSEWDDAARRLHVPSIRGSPPPLHELRPILGELTSEPERLESDGADLEIDQEGCVVRRRGSEVALTPTEFRLLVDLHRNAGCVMSKRQLLERVWGFDAYDDNVVEVHLSSLRRKLEAHGPRLIQTVRGFGYVFRVDGRGVSGPGGGRGGQRAG